MDRPRDDVTPDVWMKARRVAFSLMNREGGVGPTELANAILGVAFGRHDDTHSPGPPEAWFQAVKNLVDVAKHVAGAAGDRCETPMPSDRFEGDQEYIECGKCWTCLLHQLHNAVTRVRSVTDKLPAGSAPPDIDYLAIGYGAERVAEKRRAMRDDNPSPDNA